MSVMIGRGRKFFVSRIKPPVTHDCKVRGIAIMLDVNTKQTKEALPSRDLGLFDMREIKVGKPLGIGGFCSVHSVSDFRLVLHRQNSDLTESQVAARQMVAQDARDHQDRKGSSPFAIKFLHRHLEDKPRLLRVAKRDLKTEVELLQQVSHPNIIKLRGHGLSGMSGESGGLSHHFIILDRLEDTLAHRLERDWKKREKRHCHPVMKVIDKHGLKRKQFLLERLKVATEIASALEHLHANRIIYRDLKPSNVGFSKTGQVKLIDFGLARKLPGDGSKSLDDTFKMTSRVGTCYYMAPEISKKHPYNELADVYSFAIVLQNIMNLHKPYEAYSMRTHTVTMEQGFEHAPIDHEWPQVVQELLKKSLSPNMNDRPSMKEVVTALKA